MEKITIRERITSLLVASAVVLTSIVGGYSINALPALADTKEEKVLSEEDFANLCSQVGMASSGVNVRAIYGDYSLDDIESINWLDEFLWYSGDMTLTLVSRGNVDATIRVNGTEVAVSHWLSVSKEIKVPEESSESSESTESSETSEETSGGGETSGETSEETSSGTSEGGGTSEGTESGDTSEETSDGGETSEGTESGDTSVETSEGTEINETSEVTEGTISEVTESTEGFEDTEMVVVNQSMLSAAMDFVGETEVTTGSLNFYTINIPDSDFYAGENTVQFEVTIGEELRIGSYTIKHYTPVDVVTTTYPSKAIVTDDRVFVGRNSKYVIDISGDYTDLVVCVDGAAISNELEFSVNKDGLYTVNVRSLNGEEFSYSLFEGKRVVVSTNAPRVNCEVDNSPLLNGWYTEADELKFVITSPKDGVLITNKVLLVNGKRVNLSDDDTVKVSALPTANDGIYNIVFQIADNVGNDAEYSFVFKLDGDAPIFDDTKLEGLHTNKGITYVDQMFTFGNEAFRDEKSGIKVIQYKEYDEYVDVTLPYSVSNLTGMFRVVDNAGNEKEFVVAEICEGFVFDMDTPSISVTYPTPDLESWGKYFFKNLYSITYNVTETYIKSSSCTVNGKSVAVTLDKKGSFTLNLSKVCSADNEYTVIFKVVDVCDKVAEERYTFIYDTAPPEKGSLAVDGMIAFSDVQNEFIVGDPVSLIGYADDKGSGVKSVVLLKDGEPVFSNYIEDSGEFTIKLTDNLDNEVEIALGDILGQEGITTVVRDVNSPLVKVTIAEAPYTDKDNRRWYKSKPTISYTITDNDLTRYSVYINGIETPYTVPENAVSEDGTIVIANAVDLSKITDTRIDIVIEAYDELNHKVRYPVKIGVDTVKPNMNEVTVSVNGETRKEGKTLFINGSIVVSGRVFDEGSGLKSLSLLNNATVDRTFTNGNIHFDITKSGKFSLTAEDNLGNTNTLNLLSFLDCSEIVIDYDKPVIKRVDSEKEAVPGWYKDAPKLQYDIQDENLKRVEAYINGSLVASSSKVGVLTINTSKYLNMRVDLRVVAEDSAGNMCEVAYSYTHDNQPPVNITAQGDRPVYEKRGTFFYNAPAAVTLNAEDKGIGLGGFEMNGTRTSSSFSINSDGQFLVRAYDRLNNMSDEIGLGELLGLSGSKVVFDNVAPSVSGDLPFISGSFKEGWYNQDITFSINLSDNIGLDRVTVKINGVEVASQSYPNLDVRSESIQIDTSRATPSSDGSYHIEVEVEDNAKLKTNWSNTIYIDKTAPIIKSFLISGDVKVTGRTQGGSDSTYGIFFDGKGSIQVTAEDVGVSSGIRSICYKFDGSDWVEKITNGDTVIYVTVPEDYKGTFRAYAVDNVGLKSEEDMPDGLVSESSNTHTNHSRIDITFETTNHYDENNLPLFNKATSATANVSCDWSGLSKLEWGINGSTLGTVTDFSGAKSWDKNLPLSFNTDLSLTENENAQTLWVRVTDNVNRTSENSRQFSIDMDSPVVTLSFDQNKTSYYYNTDRVATLTITDRNFDSSLVSITGSQGYIGSWHRNGDAWSSNISFTTDGEYQFAVSCVDRAGNQGNTVDSGVFVIDKSSPTVEVTMSNNAPRNGKYYSKPQTAFIVVSEKNFDANLIDVRGGSISGWTSNGDTHTTSVTFDTNGVYTLSVDGFDKAGNAMVHYSSGEFIIDLDAPEVKIGGVSNGVSYKGEVGFAVVISDRYFDSYSSMVMLTGKTHSGKELLGTLNESGETVYSYNDFETAEDVDDVYTLSITAVDLAGNITKKEVTFSVNRFGSKYAIVNEGLLGGYFNSPEDIVITELNVDRLDKFNVRVVVTVDGKQLDVNKYLVIDEEEFQGKYLYTYTIKREALTVDGKYIVQVFSTSKVGDGYTSANEEYSFMVDTTPPNIILSGIEDNALYKEYNKVVTLDIRDASGVKEILVTLNGKPVVTTYENGIYSFSIQEGDGRSKVEVAVTDLAGNTTNLSVENFLITSNLMTYLWNQTWVKIVLGGVLVLAGGLIFVLIRGSLKRRGAESAMAREAANYRSSTANPSSGSSGSTTTGSEQVVPSADESTALMEEEKTGIIGDDSATGAVSDADESKTSIIEDEDKTNFIDNK